MDIRSFFLALIVLCFFSAVGTWADVPQQLNYQGYLTDTGGNPLDTTVAMTFKLYTDSTAGSLLWTETRPSVSVAKGLFNVRLGQVTTLGDAVFNNAQVWLGITVGDNSEMTPRSRIVSVGYAYRVGTVDSASGGTIIGKMNMGLDNTNTGEYAFVAGRNNHANGAYSVVAGGGGATQLMDSNSARGDYSAIGGGRGNNTSGTDATVGGGRQNGAAGLYATVGGGYGNNASGFAMVGGGYSNAASGSSSTVGGGRSNVANADYTTVGGGIYNNAYNSYATVSGGTLNNTYGWCATVGGGRSNLATDSSTTVSGGYDNSAFGDYTTVSGGYHNSSNSSYVTIAGGRENLGTGGYSAVGGGRDNTAAGWYSAVGGGYDNTASGSDATVGGGAANTASEIFATVPGGCYNTASGGYTFAAGYRAKALHAGSFVWADSWDADFVSSAANQVSIRAIGGTRIYSSSGLMSGVILAANSSAWISACDSAKKRNLRLVDTKEVLDKVAQLPIKQWSYKAADPSIEHVGPMAQDFYKLFHLGEDSLGISTIDPAGIALAAIQELQKQNAELRERNSTLEREVAEIKTQLQQLCGQGSNSIKQASFTQITR